MGKRERDSMPVGRIEGRRGNCDTASAAGRIGGKRNARRGASNHGRITARRVHLAATVADDEAICGRGARSGGGGDESGVSKTAENVPRGIARTGRNVEERCSAGTIGEAV